MIIFIILLIALAVLSTGFAFYQGVQAWKSRKALEQTRAQFEREREKARSGWVPWKEGATEEEKASALLCYVQGEDLQGSYPRKRG